MRTVTGRMKKSVASAKATAASQRYEELLQQVHRLTRRVDELEGRAAGPKSSSEDPAVVRARMVRRWEELNAQEDEEAHGWSHEIPHAA